MLNNGRVRSILALFIVVAIALHLLVAALIPFLPFAIAILIFLLIASLIF